LAEFIPNFILFTLGSDHSFPVS